jgi:hypothetical protein
MCVDIQNTKEKTKERGGLIQENPRIAKEAHRRSIKSASGTRVSCFYFNYRGMQHTNSVNYLHRLVNGFV